MSAETEFNEDTLKSFESCRAVCDSEATCIQFSHAPGKCTIAKELRRGHAAEAGCLEYSNAVGQCLSQADKGQDGMLSTEAMKSGWMLDRVTDYIRRLDESCIDAGNKDWVT